MIAFKTKLLKTERLTLKPFEKEDLFTLSELLQDPWVTETYMVPSYQTRNQYEKLAEKLISFSAAEDETHYVVGVYLDGKLIGMVNDCGTEGNTVEIGYCLFPGFWNKGFMTEAMSETIKEMFCMGFETVRTGYFEGNQASRRVMEKCGMSSIAFSDHIEYRGKKLRVFYYEKQKA